MKTEGGAWWGRTDPRERSFAKIFEEALDFGFWICYVTGNDTGTNFQLGMRPPVGQDSRVHEKDREEGVFIK